MGKLNVGRIVLGGLLAGLIINISESVVNGIVLAKDMEEAMRALNRPPIDSQMVIWFIVMGFALGITTVWLYAAIRPRFGPGVKTAVIIAMPLYFLAYVYPSVFIGLMNLFPARVMVIGVVWGLPEIVIASIAGAWLYTEV